MNEKRVRESRVREQVQISLRLVGIVKPRKT